MNEARAALVERLVYLTAVVGAARRTAKNAREREQSARIVGDADVSAAIDEARAANVVANRFISGLAPLLDQLALLDPDLSARAAADADSALKRLRGAR